MQTTSQNKAMSGKSEAEKSKQQFAFPGGGQYVPQTIEASSREEAEKEWEKTREEVNN